MGASICRRRKAIGSNKQSSSPLSLRARHVARQFLPPILADALRGVRDGASRATDWEYRGRSWPVGEPGVHGWDVEAVAATQLARWPAFVTSVEGAAPFGNPNESGEPRQADYETHNTILSFGYVLSRAAIARNRLSMLDWVG